MLKTQLLVVEIKYSKISFKEFIFRMCYLQYVDMQMVRMDIARIIDNGWD